MVPGALWEVVGWAADGAPLACCCIISAENGEPGNGMWSPACADGVACVMMHNREVMATKYILHDEAAKLSWVVRERQDMLIALPPGLHLHPL